MSDNNSLITSEKSTLEVINKCDLGDIIKPFIREIYLFETYVAGTAYIDNQELFESLEKYYKVFIRKEEL